MTVAADFFLYAGILAELVCVIGVVWMKDTFDQLHFSAAGSTLGPLLIAVAVVLTGFSSLSGTVECVVAVAALITLNPVLTHATGRLAWRASGGATAEDAATERETAP